MWLGVWRHGGDPPRVYPPLAMSATEAHCAPAPTRPPSVAAQSVPPLASHLRVSTNKVAIIRAPTAAAITVTNKVKDEDRSASLASMTPHALDLGYPNLGATGNPGPCFRALRAPLHG